MRQIAIHDLALDQASEVQSQTAELDDLGERRREFLSPSAADRSRDGGALHRMLGKRGAGSPRLAMGPNGQTDRHDSRQCRGDCSGRSTRRAGKIYAANAWRTAAASILWGVVIGLLLILVAAILANPVRAQSCRVINGRQVCGPTATSRVVSRPNSAWENHAVRVIVEGRSSTGYGSGTILASNAAGKELVITAAHVVGSDQPRLFVQWRGQRYPARFLARAQDGDLSAIETDVPGTIRTLGIADSTPDTAIMHGYGPSDQLHEHSGRRISGMDAYDFPAHDGDSGGGVFNASGEFAGVVWGSDGRIATVASTSQMHRFLSVHQTQAIGPNTTGSGRKVCVIFPFFWKVTTWNNGQGSVIVDPAQPVTPYQPPIIPQPSQPVVVAGPPGPAGPSGAPGPAGPPGATPDISGLLADVAQLKGQMASITSILQSLQTTTAATAALVQKPITFLDPQADGSEQARAVGLGGTIRLSIPQAAANHAAQAQQRATPQPPTPGK